MVIFGIKMAILYFKKAKEISKHILIWMAAINCDSNLVFIYFTMCLITFLSLKYEKGLKMAIFCSKVAILDFKMTLELSKNIFVWTAAIKFTSNFDLIHFTIFFITFRSLKYQKDLKMAIFGLKMALLDFKRAKELSKNIYIWTAAKKCNGFRANIYLLEYPVC